MHLQDTVPENDVLQVCGLGQRLWSQGDVFLNVIKPDFSITHKQYDTDAHWDKTCKNKGNTFLVFLDGTPVVLFVTYQNCVFTKKQTFPRDVKVKVASNVLPNASQIQN